MNNNGGGFKHQRVNVSLVAGGQARILVVWGTPFADANYTVSATMERAFNAAGSLRINQVFGKNPNSISVFVENIGVGDDTGVINIIAIHD